MFLIYITAGAMSAEGDERLTQTVAEGLVRGQCAERTDEHRQGRRHQSSQTDALRLKRRWVCRDSTAAAEWQPGTEKGWR